MLSCASGFLNVDLSWLRAQIFSRLGLFAGKLYWLVVLTICALRSAPWPTMRVRRSCGQISMSRKANCWDNAAIESFFSRLKVELVYAEDYHSIEEAKSGIFEYIEVFYNRIRRHSALGYISPAKYERLNA